MEDQLDPQDVAVLRMLAGANFLGGSITLPSGRVLSNDEMQALTSVYAPAVGEPEAVTDVALSSAMRASTVPGRMPRDGESLVEYYLANGGDPNNERTLAILREADRSRAEREG